MNFLFQQSIEWSCIPVDERGCRLHSPCKGRNCNSIVRDGKKSMSKIARKTLLHNTKHRWCDIFRPAPCSCSPPLLLLLRAPQRSTCTPRCIQSRAHHRIESAGECASGMCLFLFCVCLYCPKCHACADLVQILITPNFNPAAASSTWWTPAYKTTSIGATAA